VERICPYLALADDGRTVADGFDAEHRCHALTPPAPLDRARQVQLCLTEAHVRCERFAAARTAWLAASSGLPRVAPDVAFGRTRLIVEPEPAGRGRAGAPMGRFSRRTVVVAAAGGTLVVALGLAGISGAFSGTPAASASPTPEATSSTTPTTAPPSSVEASASVAPTVAASNPVTPTAATTPAATPRTYVVRSGDTLNGIATQFGTTAAAIRAANGLTGDQIDVGDVLIIP
jgi:LysM repeat protein